MGSRDRAASPTHRRCTGDASATSAMHRRRRRGENWAPHRRCLADVSAMRRDPPTPSARTPTARPRD
eukprot:6727074-Pyramimonas_sp.AAC.1